MNSPASGALSRQPSCGREQERVSPVRRTVGRRPHSQECPHSGVNNWQDTAAVPLNLARARRDRLNSVGQFLMLTKTLIYYGREEAPPEPLALRAGPLSMRFDPDNAFLRQVRLGEREVVRAVYAAVRDETWGTVPPRVHNLETDIAHDRFTLSFDVECRKGEVDFLWRGTIRGETDGTVTYTLDGTARSTFLRNRIGFCVLHPVHECAGNKCAVEHANGNVKHSAFPALISPHQPIQDIRAITHEAAPGVSAELRFSGDVFEMEDQRNWTDMSFKTYCTPLALPMPVRVREGTRITQSVTLTLNGSPTAPASPRASEIEITLGEALGPLPEIGLGTASHGQRPTERERERLRALNLSHLRVDLKLRDTDMADTLASAASEAGLLGVPLEAALFGHDLHAEIPALAQAIHQFKPSLRRWLLYEAGRKSTSEAFAQRTRPYLSALARDIPLYGGTNENFTELNRERPPTAALDGVCYSINPQVHAFDDTSLVENLEAQAQTVASARAFCGGLPIAVSPVTLKPRARQGVEDARQRSLFGAAWTLGSVKYLVESGVSSITYYETTGRLGVMDTKMVFPLYHVLADVGEFAGGVVRRTTSSDPLTVVSLSVFKEGRTRLILANLTPQTQRVRLRNFGSMARLRQLDETNAEAAMTTPEAFRATSAAIPLTDGAWELPPFAVACYEEEAA